MTKKRAGDGQLQLPLGQSSTATAESVVQCMRRGNRGGPDEYTWDEYKAELLRLVNEYGEDFVCDHACDRLRDSEGVACHVGSCAELDAYDGVTCRDACRTFIELFLGHRIDPDTTRSTIW